MDFNALIEFDKQLLLAVNGSDSTFIDGLAMVLTKAATWIPLYLSLFYVVVKNNHSVQKVLLIVACAGLCVLFAGALDDWFVKPGVARWRPTHDPEIGMLVDTVNNYRGGNYGFFSAHASNTFSIAIFFTLLIRNRVLSVFLIAWSLINCWTRMYLGVHYPGDILVGLIWGGTVGTFIWMLHQKVSKRWLTENTYVSEQYTASGYLRKDCQVIFGVLGLTLVYAVIRAFFYF